MTPALDQIISSPSGGKNDNEAYEYFSILSESFNYPNGFSPADRGTIDASVLQEGKNNLSYLAAQRASIVLALPAKPFKTLVSMEYAPDSPKAKKDLKEYEKKLLEGKYSSEAVKRFGRALNQTAKRFAGKDAPGGRRAYFIQMLGCTKIPELLALGISIKEIELMQNKAITPNGYNIHHINLRASYISCDTSTPVLLRDQMSSQIPNALAHNDTTNLVFMRMPLHNMLHAAYITQPYQRLLDGQESFSRGSNTPQKRVSIPDMSAFVGSAYLTPKQQEIAQALKETSLVKRLVFQGERKWREISAIYEKQAFVNFDKTRDAVTPFVAEQLFQPVPENVPNVVGKFSAKPVCSPLIPTEVAERIKVKGRGR